MEGKKMEADSEEKPNVSRRNYLGAVAGSILVNTADTSAKETKTDDVKWLQEGDEYLHNQVSFSLKDTRVLNAFSYYSTPDSIRVQERDGLQYIFANLQFDTAKESRPPVSKFALLANKKRYEAGKAVDRIPLHAITDAYPQQMGQPYHTKPMEPPEDAIRTPPKYQNPVFTVGFAAPTELSASQLGFSLISDDRAEIGWQFNASVEENLRSAPQFEVVSLDIPERISEREKFEASISIRNNGERAGKYEAILGLKESNHKKRVALQVPAGEEVTQKKQLYSPPTIVGDSLGDTAVYQLIRADGVQAEAEATVEVN